VKFLRTHVRELRRRKVWLFHSGPIGPASDLPEEVPPDVARLAVEIEAPTVRTFAGELQEDAVIGRSARRAGIDEMVGDSRDWEDIRAWADQIAATLSSAEAQR
jgi:menaquinone-dependent protoporphyrinogen oxidase